MSGGSTSNTSGGHAINVDMSEVIPKKLKGDMKWGREFYMKNCFTCHGVKGNGDGPRAYFNQPRPRDFTSDASRQILNRPRVFDSITNGRVGTVMPAWGKVLSDQEIANLTEFVFQAFIQGKGAGVPDKTGKTNTEAGKKKAS
jgi:mono/diheme cytochrome c family protein